MRARGEIKWPGWIGSHDEVDERLVMSRQMFGRGNNGEKGNGYNEKRSEVKAAATMDVDDCRLTVAKQAGSVEM